jgi:hypothetical protein
VPDHLGFNHVENGHCVHLVAAQHMDDPGHTLEPPHPAQSQPVHGSQDEGGAERKAMPPVTDNAQWFPRDPCHRPLDRWKGQQQL